MTGVLIKPSGAIAANVDLRRLSIDQNSGEGLRIDGTGGSGAINTAITDSALSLNGGNAIDVVSGPGSVSVGITRLTASRNAAAAIVSNQSNGGTASVAVGSSLISGNALAAQALGGASLLSYGNNQVSGNATNGGFTGMVGLQ